jgi:4'-phosphopantetheinyl transferase
VSGLAPVLAGEWASGPDRPRALTGEVHVWRIRLDADRQSLPPTLTVDERRRAEAFLRREDGLRWAASRVALRGILGRYLDLVPGGIRFRRGPGGKPNVAGAPFQYNLTHSFDLALCAIGPMDLGVDLEKLRPAPMAAGVAAGIVSDAGPIRPGEPASAELDWAFFHAWTCVEATLKATGEGLSAIDRRSPEWIRILASPGRTDLDGRPLTILDLPVDDGYAGALAILGAPGVETIRLWSWPG